MRDHAGPAPADEAGTKAARMMRGGLYRLGTHEPQLPPSGDVWIAPSCHLIGDVRLGTGCSVWFGAVLRGDNMPIVIGARTNIQEYCIGHVDDGFELTIGAGCTIGHRAIMHGCTIGDHCLVGMGAVILNGARIGDHCLIGAGALVTEGSVCEPGSLVIGMPARVRRPLSKAEIDNIHASAEDYHRKAQEFRKTLALTDSRTGR